MVYHWYDVGSGCCDASPVTKSAQGLNGNSGLDDHFFSQPCNNHNRLVMILYKWSPSVGKIWSGSTKFPGYALVSSVAIFYYFNIAVIF